MKKMYLAILAVLLWGSAVTAQTPTPAAVPSALTVANLPAIGLSADGFFPELPLSRPCKQDEIIGQIWRLQNVFEKPTGKASDEFRSKRIQFISFDEDSTYRSHKDVRTPSSRRVAKRLLDESIQKEMVQYVFQDNLVYYYKNSEVAATDACFIVTTGRGQFSVGQMLLMPTIDRAVADGVRLVKAYQKWDRGREDRAREGKRERKREGRKRKRNRKNR